MKSNPLQTNMTQPLSAPLHWINLNDHNQVTWTNQYLQKKGLLSKIGMYSITQLATINELPLEIQLIAPKMRAAWNATNRRKNQDKVKTCNWEISKESYSHLQSLSKTSSIKKTIENLINQAYYHRKEELDEIKEEKRKLKDREDKLKQRSQELDLREAGITNVLDKAPLKARDIAQQAFIKLAQHLWTSIYENISSIPNIKERASPCPEDLHTIHELYKEQQAEILASLQLSAESSSFLKETIKNRSFTQRFTD